MNITIDHGKSYATAKVELSPGESVKAEAGAMLAMKGDPEMQTASGGLLKGLKRSLMGGESFFQNTFTARNGNATIWLAPALPGDLLHTRLDGQHALIVQDGSYLASSPHLDVDTRFTGARSFFAGEGFVMLRISGTGELILSSYGAIEKHELKHGETMVVDTGHLVGFTEGMHHDLSRVSRGMKSLFFSGEGIVSRFTGPGTIYTQSRSSQSFLQWLSNRLPGGGGGSGGRGGFLGAFE